MPYRQIPREQTTFKRTEKKYLISARQYDCLMQEIHGKVNPDCHKKCTVFNIYLDTPDYLLIRRSLDKPIYKEKLRLRSYGFPDAESQVFLEIKKKYKKVVYKRRVKMTYRDALSFLRTNEIPAGHNLQILKEISWSFKFYKNLSPAMLISYERSAYYGEGNGNLRITFDNNLMWQDMRGSPDTLSRKYPLLKDGLCLMEIKSPDSMPLWLASLLSDLKIYPLSFSKYGTAYKQKLSKGEINYA